MEWNDVRHFLALARTGSARAAGAQLGVSHSTVVRRIEAFEEGLCARLFNRTRDGYSLTDAGQQMVPRAERIETEMAALERELSGQDGRLQGRVAITCCDSYVSDLVLAALAPFCQAHPEIELAFTNAGRLFDLAKGEADIGVRVLRTQTQPQDYLVGKRMVPLVLASYVARTRAPQLDPDAGGTEARWIGFDDRRMMEQLVAGSSHPDLPIWSAFGTLELMHQAARSGLGIAMLPTYVGDADPDLCRLASADPRHVADLWLVVHPDLRSNERVKAARVAVAAALQAHAPLFAGERCPNPAPVRPAFAPSRQPTGPLGSADTGRGESKQGEAE